MAGKNTAVFGIYNRRSDLDDAIQHFNEAGFRHEDISVLLPENLGSKELATLKSSKAPEGASVGAASGAVLGGALGWLAGIGALAIPGIGPLIAAGPIVAALAGLGAAGAIGGVAGALVGLGVPEFEAKRYDGKIKGGGILLSVHCDNSEWIKKAKDILSRTGAEDISSATESAGDYGSSDKPRPVATSDLGQRSREALASSRTEAYPATSSEYPPTENSVVRRDVVTGAPYVDSTASSVTPLNGGLRQAKGSIKQEWGKLTDNDVEVIDGRRDQLIGLLQERYGISREDASEQVDRWDQRPIQEVATDRRAS